MRISLSHQLIWADVKLAELSVEFVFCALPELRLRSSLSVALEDSAQKLKIRTNKLNNLI